MAYRGNDWEDNSSVAVPGSGEEAREMLEHQLRDNNSRIKSLHLDSNGKESSFLGIKIPRSVAPFFQLGLDYVKVLGVDQNHAVYTKCKELAEGFLPQRLGRYSRKIAAFTEGAYLAGIIGAEQIVDFVQASSKYAAARKEILERFSTVTKATGEKPTNIKMVQLALDEANHEYWEDIKRMSADAPKLLSLALLGLQKHKESVELRTRAATEEEALKAADPNYTKLTPHQQLLARQTQRADWVEEQVDQRRISFIEKKLQQNSSRSQEYWEQYFDDRLADGYRENLHKGWDNEISPEKEARNKKNDTMLKWAATIAPLGTEVLKANMVDSGEERRNRVHSWDMIEHLAKDMEGQRQTPKSRDYDEYDGYRRPSSLRSGDDIYVTSMGEGWGGEIPLKQFILDIFQQHERDLQPDKSFRDKNGAPIDPLGAPLVKRLQPAVDMIAETIADGRLSPEALHILVGNDKIIKHNTKGAMVFANQKEVKAALDEVLPVLGIREVMQLDQVLADFSDHAKTEEAIKQNLEHGKGKEKALFATLLPDDVLRQEGLRNKDIVKLRKEAHHDRYDFMMANAVHLAAQDDEKLSKLGLTEPQMTAVREVAEKVEMGDRREAQIAIDTNREVQSAIRLAGLNEQMSNASGEGADYWANRIKEMDAVREKLKRTAAEQEVSPNHPDVGDHIRELARRGRPQPQHERFAERFERNEQSELMGERELTRRAKASDSPYKGVEL